MRDMSNYEENLRHIVRPDERSERRKSPSVTLDDYEALYLSEALAEYAAYECERGGEYEGIALGLVEYIERTVRDEGRSRISIYAHTPEAQMVLVDALDAYTQTTHDLHAAVKTPIDLVWKGDDDG